MSFDGDKLYELLPAVHRIRDAEQGEPLRQLIEVIAGQTAVLEENLAQLYDNNFVETAAPWVLPYIGDLLGIRGLSGGGTLTRAPRAEVGHTIAYRRRKGTAAILELLARDVTGWSARAVEFFERLATTQHFNHIRIANRAFTSLRLADELEFFGTAFETATRTVEVRRIESVRGKWNIPNVGLFLWRLSAYPLTRTPLVAALAPFADDRHFRFHPLGIDVPLFSLPETEDEFTHLAEPLNVPMPISRRMLAGESFPPEPVKAEDRPTWANDYFPWPNQFHPSADYYGAGRSIRLERHVDEKFHDIVGTEILVANLSDTKDKDGNPIWAHEKFGKDNGKVLLDPMLGRVVFPAAHTERVFATFYRGFSADIGGGEYNRSSSFDTSTGSVVEVANTDASKPASVEAGLAALGAASGVVEILDSSRYEEVLSPIDATSRQIEIRAADGRWPTLILGQKIEIIGDADGVVTLNGLLISGAGIEITGELGRLRLRHCTLVPLGTSPSLTVNSETTVIEIEDCIIGPICVGPDITVQLKNSIVDAIAPTNVALSDVDSSGPAGTWRIENCTICGKVNVSVLELASNTIFVSELAAADNADDWPAPLFVQRRQEGCVRFSWLPPNARAPRRYECLPNDESPDVRPIFTSLRFGDAAYCQLSYFCPDVILTGADDEAEMGVFHDLFQPQRKAQLIARLDEYLRFGLEAGIFYAT
jgi:hypothetical protein